MLRGAIVFLLFFIILSAQAQIAQPGRFEIELDTFDDEFFVLSGNEQGLLVYKPLSIFEGRKQLWKFIKLDTALQVQWEREYYIDQTNLYRGYDFSGANFSLLFQITERNSLDLMVLQLDIFNGDTSRHRIKNLVRLQLDQFEMNPQAAVIAGYYNTDPVVIHYDLKTRKTKVLPGIYGNKTELAHVRVEDDYINILLTARSFDNANTLTLKTYSPNGDYLDSYTFQPAEDVGLVFGRVAKLDVEGSLISGTYGTKKSEFSRGLFIAQHSEEEKQRILYYNYADLENFFTYLKAKRQKRISEKITRKKVKGKKVKFNYRLLVHDIMKNGDEYIMIGEAFYPKYDSYSSYNSVNSFGTFNNFSNRDYTPSSFAGYRYTHAVAIGFNEKGDVLWDNSFEIDDVVSFQLEQFVHADVHDDKIVLMYLYENEIRTKIIRGSEVVEGKSFNNMRLAFEDDVINDKSSYADVGGLEKWYGHTYYGYGVQKIKNLRDSGVKLNRKVFYINKMRYDESAVQPDESEELVQQAAATGEY
jgi:hypothetical protein